MPRNAQNSDFVIFSLSGLFDFLVGVASVNSQKPARPPIGGYGSVHGEKLWVKGPL